jgi:hypothetical protein
MITPITIFPPTTNSPNAAIMELTASGPLCPSLNIDLVVAIFKDNLKSTRINSNVGNVDRSVGFWINKDIRSINIADVNDNIRKKSNIAFGNGTIIIANIAKINPISTYSLRNSISLIFI